MHNAFIADRFFGYETPAPSRRVHAVNWLLAKLGCWVRLAPPVATGLMTNVEQRMNMFHLVSQVLAYGVPGDLVELGCHEGLSAVLMQMVIEHHDPSRVLHVYDSFDGLPEIHPADTGTTYQAGWLKATPDALVNNFKAWGLRLPEVHAGWFQDTLPTGLPEKICFAHLDGDLYQSILVSLEHVYPRLSPGAICLIDDYNDPQVLPGWNQLPGVRQACDEFLADKLETVSVLWAAGYSHGYFRKR